jgi:hypothetical protein
MQRAASLRETSGGRKQGSAKQYRRQSNAGGRPDRRLGKLFQETADERCSVSGGETAFFSVPSVKHGIVGNRDNSEFSDGERLDRLAFGYGRERCGCRPENVNRQLCPADPHTGA